MNNTDQTTPLTILSPDKSENWFKPCNESINSPETSSCVSDVTNKTNDVVKTSSLLSTSSLPTCLSTTVTCSMTPLKGFEFCHQHILEDVNSPFKRCSFLLSDGQHCTHPAPKLGLKNGEKTYCIQHEEERKKNRNKKRKLNREKRKEKNEGKGVQRKRPSNLPLSKRTNTVKQEESSSEEEYSFFTDSTQVNKSECLWLGNQASDADSTDSEDDYPLHHAGAWTLEECLFLCEKKMSRLRSLYNQQYKHLNYYLREERRKMLTKYDMDPYLLSKIPFHKRTGNDFEDYVYDMHLTNYQRPSGADELIAEKQSKEKRTKGTTVHSRRTDLPRCIANKESQRCTQKVLPFSRYCHQHIVNDSEQYLYESCSHTQPKKCSKPSDIFSSTCSNHTSIVSGATEKAYETLQTAMKVRETRKRKRDENQRKEREIKERTRRTSQRLELKSPTSTPPPECSTFDDKGAVSTVSTETSSSLLLSVEALLLKDIVDSVVKTVETKIHCSDGLCATPCVTPCVTPIICAKVDSDTVEIKDDSTCSIVDIVSEATLSSEEILEVKPDGLNTSNL